VIGLIFHLWLQKRTLKTTYQNQYIRANEWFMNNYFNGFRRISLFLIKIIIINFMQSLWKDTRKPNHNFRRVRKITNLEYLLRYVCISNSNNSESHQRNVIKFNIWKFLKYLWKKIKFLSSLSQISGIS
jgi:hypothetical protein